MTGVFHEFEELKDEPVSSVIFVMDYIQIGFNGPLINLTGTLSLVKNGEVIVDGEPLFENGCRLLIGQYIMSASRMENDSGFSVSFSSGMELRSVYLSPEAFSYINDRLEPPIAWYM